MTSLQYDLVIIQKWPTFYWAALYVSVLRKAYRRPTIDRPTTTSVSLFVGPVDIVRCRLFLPRKSYCAADQKDGV